VKAGLHVSYDSVWDVMFKGDMPLIDALFFAGGAAYVEAFGKKMDIVSAYGKIAGNFDITECAAGDGDEQSIKLSMRLQVLFRLFEYAIDAELCKAGAPCKTEFLTDGLHEKPLGTFTIFSFSTIIMAGPVPVKFEVGAQLDTYVEFGLSGHVGRPELGASEKNFHGFHHEDHPPMAKITAQAGPGIRAEVYGQVGVSIGIGTVGGGLEISIIDIQLPVASAYNFNSKKSGLAVGLEVSSLGGRLYIFIEFGWCPACYEKDWTIIEWRGPSKTSTLFETGPCKECEVKCVYGVCDRATGTSCACAKGWHGDSCDIPCPGKLQGKPVCNGNYAMIEDDEGGQVDDPDEGCRYDEAGMFTYCNCKHPYFGDDCASTYPGLMHCQWSSADGGVCSPAKEHGSPLLEHAAAACRELDSREICERTHVCHGRGEGISATGHCDCDDGWHKDPHSQSCSISCPGVLEGNEACFGNGQCTAHGTAVRCMCSEGFAGHDCSISCPRGSEGAICAGQGKCFVVGGAAHCSCSRGFKGETCEEVHDGPGYALHLPKEDVVHFTNPVELHAHLAYQYTISAWLKIENSDTHGAATELQSIEIATGAKPIHSGHKFPEHVRFTQTQKNKLIVSQGHMTRAGAATATSLEVNLCRKKVDNDSPSKYSTYDDGGFTRSVEDDVGACGDRCLQTTGCSFYSYWEDGGCHLTQSSSAKPVAWSVTKSGSVVEDCTENAMWHYVAVTLHADSVNGHAVSEGGEMKVYVSGDGEASWYRGTLANSHERDPMTSIRVPQRHGGANVISSMVMDELRVEMFAVTEEEIRAAANTLLSGFEMGLQLYYMFDEASGDAVYDQAGPPAKNDFNHGRIMGAGHAAVLDGGHYAGSRRRRLLANEATEHALEATTKAGAGRRRAGRDRASSSTVRILRDAAKRKGTAIRSAATAATEMLVGALGQVISASSAETEGPVTAWHGEVPSKEDPLNFIEARAVQAQHTGRLATLKEGLGAEEGRSLAVKAVEGKTAGGLLEVQQRQNLLSKRSSQKMKKGCCIGCRRHTISKWSGSRFSYWNNRIAPVTAAIVKGRTNLKATRTAWLAGFAKDVQIQVGVAAFNANSRTVAKGAANKATERRASRTAAEKKEKGKRMNRVAIWEVSDASIETASVVGIQRDIADDVKDGNAVLVNIPIASDFHFQTASIKIIGPKSNWQEDLDRIHGGTLIETYANTADASLLIETTDEVGTESKLSEGGRNSRVKRRRAGETAEAKTRHQRERSTLDSKFRQRARRSTADSLSAKAAGGGGASSFIETLSGKGVNALTPTPPSNFGKTLMGKGRDNAAALREKKMKEAENKKKERANSVAFWSDLGPTLSRVGSKNAVEKNWGRLDMYLNGKKLTKDAVWHTHATMYTYWEYELTREDMAHLHDGVNDLKVVPWRSHETSITVLDVFINTQVKVTNGFLQGDGATFLSSPFTLLEAEELKSDFTIEQWVRLPQKQTTFAKRCMYDGDGDLPGEGVTTVNDAEACMNRCGAIPACAFFGYKTDAKSCKLYSNVHAEHKIEMVPGTMNTNTDVFTPGDGGTDEGALGTNFICGPTSASSVIISRGPPSAPHFALYDSGATGNGFHVRWANASAAGALTIVDNYNLPLGRWFHLAAAYDDVSLIVYVDGYLVAEKQVGRHAMAGWNQGNHPLNIGALWDGGSEETAVRRFVGQLDDVVVWGEGRSSQQIMKDMVETQWGDKVDEVLDSDLQNNAQDDTEALAATEARLGAKQAARDAGIDDADLEGTDDEPRSAFAEIIAQYGFEEEAGSTTVGDWTNDTDRMAFVHGDIGVSEVSHAAEIRSWRNCPGAVAIDRSAICGGINDISGKAHGMCDTYDNSCNCNYGFFGVDCSQSCPTHHTMGICSGNGDNTGVQNSGCHINLNAVIKDNWMDAQKSISANEHPDVTAPAFCMCAKPDKQKHGGFKRFLGQFCEHECPMSKHKECSGHGSCTVKSATESGGSSSAKCACEPGYFGSGCERVCAGMESAAAKSIELQVKDSTSANPSKADMCGGHGMCKYYGAHESCNAAEWTCGPGINKQCICNKKGGFFEYPHGGGTCTLAAPGASGGMEENPTDANICYGRGVAWGNGNAFGKNRGAYMRVPPPNGKEYELGNDNLPKLDDEGKFKEKAGKGGDTQGNGPTSICVKCSGYGQGSRAVDNGAGSKRAFNSNIFVGPDSCMATNQRTPGHIAAELWDAPTGGSKCASNSPVARSTVGERCGNVFSGAMRCECEPQAVKDDLAAPVAAGKSLARLLTKRHRFSPACAGSKSLEGGSSTSWTTPFRYDNGKDIATKGGMTGCGSATHHVKSWKKCW
jgi:hypothetical protein